jgi:hypothetical protein
MKNKLLALAAGFLVLCQGSALAADLVDDVKQFRSTNKDAIADISRIAQQYIAAGQSKEMVERYLTAHEFALHYQPVASGQPQTLVAVHAEAKGLSSLGFHDEIRVIVTFENGLAKTVNGKLIYRAL